MATGHSSSTHKQCSTCREIKRRSEFGKNAREHDGQHYSCKACLGKRAPQGRCRNRDKERAYYRATKDDHIRRAAERRQRVGSLPETVKQIQRARQRWRQKNLAHVRASDAARRAKKDPKFKMKVRRNSSNARARLRNAFVENVDPAKVFERDAWMCGICLTLATPETASLDHIVPLARGGRHEYANVQCAHLVCNMRKGALLQSEISFVR